MSGAVSQQLLKGSTATEPPKVWEGRGARGQRDTPAFSPFASHLLLVGLSVRSKREGNPIIQFINVNLLVQRKPENKLRTRKTTRMPHMRASAHMR